MSSPTISKGRTWANGETVTPARLNTLVDSATLNFTKTNVLAGRSTSGAGVAEEIDCTSVGRDLIGAANSSAQRTVLGLGSVATQAASAVALTGGSAGLDVYQANNDTIVYGASIQLEFATTAKTTQTISLAGDLTLTTTNLASGRCKFLRLVGHTSDATLVVPAGWKFVNSAAPSTLAANKVALLFLLSFGTADSAVVASYAVQP